MANLKKIGSVLACSALSFGMISSIATASTTLNVPEKVQIQIASTETIFTKNDLIKKFHSFFPKQFDFLTTGDFHMGRGHYFFDDGTLRHDLSFSKTIEGKQIYGNVSFVGEDLEIESFSYQPANVSEALFPAKVSKEEAKKIATNFIKNFTDGEKYQLETDSFNYFSQQLLTEPIRYSFSYTRTENQVPVSDQIIRVSVLGNGEIVDYYKNPEKMDSSTFEDVKQMKNKNEILEKVKGNLFVDLQYQLNYDYQTNDRSVRLVYQPTNLQGIHALSGKWLTANGYSADLPGKTKIEKITTTPLPPKHNGITVEEAKKIAEQLLTPSSDKVKFTIQSIEDVENHYGQAVIRIQYMYTYGNGGSGTNLEINKQTGEIIQYHNIERQITEQAGDEPNKENALTYKEARTQAIKYLKEMVPSYLHNYANPVEEAYIEERNGSYHFSFPRIVNGVIVIGDQISVGIAADGSLNSLNVDYQDVEQWPSIDKVITEDEAKVLFTKALDVKLTYMKQVNKKDNHHYDLVYLPVFSDEPFSSLNAITGEWNSMYGEKNVSVITHPWAEEELNYLINAKIIDIKNNTNFNGDASVSKGEAIKIIMKSLTYFYDGRYFGGNEVPSQTFDNIDPKHSAYQEIERAVSLGILKPNNQSFDFDSPIKREELAVWYLRVLGLEQAAKYKSIYKLDFEDANKVQAEYTGYVALANSMGLFKIEQNHFNPTHEVTYAQLAVSTIRLAHEMANKGRGLNN